MTERRISARPRRRVAGGLAGLVLGVGLTAGAWAGYLQATGNVHTVVPGVLVRSAQLDGASLGDLIDREGIRAVINLKGARPSKPWYREERAVAASRGVEMVDFDWNAEAPVSEEDVDRFLAVAASLPTPVLIHCQAGADRTGLASALYLAAVLGADEETAEAQLSFRYGHVGLPLTAAWPMDETFEREEARLGFRGS